MKSKVTKKFAEVAKSKTSNELPGLRLNANKRTTSRCAGQCRRVVRFIGLVYDGRTETCQVLGDAERVRRNRAQRNANEKKQSEGGVRSARAKRVPKGSIACLKGAAGVYDRDHTHAAN